MSGETSEKHLSKFDHGIAVAVKPFDASAAKKVEEDEEKSRLHTREAVDEVTERPALTCEAEGVKTKVDAELRVVHTSDRAKPTEECLL